MSGAPTMEELKALAARVGAADGVANEDFVRLTFAVDELGALRSELAGVRDSLRIADLRTKAQFEARQKAESELAEVRRALELLWDEANDGERSFGETKSHRRRAFAYSNVAFDLVERAISSKEPSQP